MAEPNTTEPPTSTVTAPLKIEPTKKIPDDTDFQQQRLRAWQPALTPKWVVIAFIILGVIYIPIGAALLYAASTVNYEQVQYDNLSQCAISTTCTVSINITADMHPPIFFYYKLENYYQNHRRYVASESVYQLHGDSDPDLSGCQPSEWQRNQINQQIIYPCGIIAGSFFNDTFAAVLIPQSSSPSNPQSFTLGDTTSHSSNPSWRTDGIAYSSDVEQRLIFNPNYFQNASAYNYTRLGTFGFQLPLVNNSDLAVWMREGALPTFKKLYRIISCVPVVGSLCSNPDSGNTGYLHAGDVITVTITNNYPVSAYNGHKYVVISTVSWLGGKNYFLGAAWIAVGGLCWILAILFGVKTLLNPPKALTLQIPAGGQLVLPSQDQLSPS